MSDFTMDKNGTSNLDPKARLVKEICAASAGCSHRSGDNEPKFVDCYRLLRVDKNADIDVIRKQYFKFALQLHPDKNSHPNAEFAFKLISQAYTCLSGEDTRRVFDLERRKNSCIICDDNGNKSGSVSSNFLAHKLKGFRLSSLDKSKSIRFWRHWKEIRERFIVEASVIETCLKSNTNNVPQKEYPVFCPSDDSLFKCYFSYRRDSKESPVFNPSAENYMFRTYQNIERRNSNNAWVSQKRSCWTEEGRRMRETPVFEVKNDLSKLHRSKSACVHPVWRTA